MQNPTLISKRTARIFQLRHQAILLILPNSSPARWRRLIGSVWRPFIFTVQ
jgi:hypothetical protein